MRGRGRRAASTGAIVASIVIIIIIIAGVAAYYYHGKAAKTTTTSPTATATGTPTGATSKTQTTSSTPAKTSTSPATSPAATTAKGKGVVVIGVTDKITDLDPANAYDFFTWEVLSNVMSGLVKYDPDTGKIVGDLATSWEVKDNGKVWIFHLRHDARFADGTPCTAQNVVWSIERVMRIKGDPSWLVTQFVQNVTALDKYTVKFVLKTPASYFLALVATPPYFPVSPHYPPDKIASDATWGGCGPYMIAKWVRDEVLVLKPNPYYYGPKPKNTEVVIKFYSSSEALRAALESGDIDIAWRTLNPDDIKAFQHMPGYKVIEVPGLFIRYVVIKVDAPPTNNKLVRQALAAAVNRPEIAELVYHGTVEPLYSLVPKGLWSHIDAFKKYGDGNIQLARKLLQEAGYSETHKLHVVLWYTPTHYGSTEAQLAAVLKQEWEKTGMIEVTVRSSEWAQFVNQLRSGQFMLSLLGWYPDYLDPDDYLTPFLMSTANGWTGTGYKNATVDKLLQEAEVLTNQTARAQIYVKVQQILAEDVPYIPLVQGKLYLVTSSKVVSLKVSPLMFLIYSSIQVQS
ncbi:MAG: ABC transporter substrate-binding protein [Desulfurococcales archaeon]|nr:ABC transporter substrate-binding protein [Desulfurococcales archaeon]